MQAKSFPGNNRRLAWALLVSLLLHSVLVADVSSLHWWQPAAPAPTPVLLDVLILPQEVPDPPSAAPRQMAPEPPPQPAQPPAPEPESSAASSVIETSITAEPPQVPQEQSPANAAQVSPSQASAKQNDDSVSQRLPAGGTLAYRFYWGKSRWLAGQAIHRWTIENGNYTLSSTVSTTGIFQLLHPLILVETSKGTIVGDTLRPLQFSTQLNDYPQAVAIFDWDKGNYRWFRGKASFVQPLSRNSYDKISYLYQLYLAREKERYFSPEITMGRHLEHYTILNLGAEEVEIDGTLYPALHLARATTSAEMEKIDIWLSTTLNYLPLKMIYANQAGDHFEQLITPDSLAIH